MVPGRCIEMTRRVRGLLVLSGVISFAIIAWLVFQPASARFAGTFPAPREVDRSAGARPAFVGSARCADCHTAQYTAWKASTHGRAGGEPSQETVIPRFDGTPLRFANATVVPRVRDGVHEFLVRRQGEPDMVLRVDGVVGAGRIHGGGTQGYFIDLGDGSWRLLPFEWSRSASTWFCNTNSRSGRGWAPITPAMRLEECGDWPPTRALGDHPRLGNCQSCHASQALVVLDSASQGYRTSFTSLDINCESCHGPAQRHVDLASTGELGKSADIGFTALATLDKDASLAVCYQCHAVKDQLRAGFASGDSLSAYYSLKLPLLGERPFTPDGRVRTFAYQEGHQFSDCYLNGGMTCVSCHDPHGQGYRSVTGASLRGRFDDAQCTSCHVSKADRVVEHTRHAAGVTSCVSCHLPARQQPEVLAADAQYKEGRVVPYARYDHSIPVPRPRVDSLLGFASACATCHLAMPVARQEEMIRKWWGETKPLPPVVESQLRVRAGMSPAEAAPLLLGDSTDAGERHAFARFAGVSRFLEGYVGLDTELPDGAERRLRELAASPDDDIRAGALASLHLAQGGNRGVRRFLAAALRADHTREAALRGRWSLMLGFMGDRYGAEGNHGAAIAAYDRALEVQPSSARLLLSLGNAQRAAGAFQLAVESYQRSIALQPREPLAWVNLGIALGELGDVQGAATALAHATTLNDAEPLAWFNLGNLALVRGDLVRARALYSRAAELDPGIPLVQFQLARVALTTGDSVAALRHLRRGLAFDASNEEAASLAAALASRLAPQK